ncbi:MAG: glycoside hydrolase family 113 [Candidatus Eiseniibacteriota bacterium]
MHRLVRPRLAGLLHGAAMVLLAACACTRLPTGPVQRFVPPDRGVTIVDWTRDGYATAAAQASLEALAATGANSVAIVITAYQSHRSAAALRGDDARTPSTAAVEQLVRSARTLGLRVALKPHVDLEDGSWRGHIAPIDPAAWFGSYRAFLLSWAALAQSLGVEQLVVGTELAGTIEHEREWRVTIAAVRAACSSELLYTASWDEAARVPFWDALDLVGVDFYSPVTDRPNAGRLEMLAGWQPWLERLERLHRRAGRDILIAEIGYRSVDGAGMAPYAFASGARLDLGEQADLYWAALQATGDRGWIRGLWWWNWPADGSGGPLNTDYTARGKPAADELAATWGGK